MNDTDIVIKLERLYRAVREWITYRIMPLIRKSAYYTKQSTMRWWDGSGEQWRWFVVAFMLALLTHIWQLDTQSLWLDEGATWAEVNDKSFGQLFGELISPDAAYPLYHLFLKGWIYIFGDSEAMLRLPSVLFSAAAVAMLTLAFPRQPQRGFLLLLMATSPIVLWHAHDAKVYSMLLLWASALTVGKPSKRWWWVMLVTLPFVHRLGLLMIAMLLIVPAMQRRGRMRQVYAGVAIGSGMIALAGIGLSIRAKTILSVPWQSPIPAATDLIARFLFDRRWSEMVFGVPVWLWVLPMLILLVTGCYTVYQHAKTGHATSFQLLILAILPVLVIVASYGSTPFFDARYAIMSLPAWMILLTYGAMRSVHNIRFKSIYIRMVRVGRFGLVLALATNLISLFEPARGLYSGAPVKEEWRAVMTEFASRVTRNDVVVVHPAYAMPMYRYYRRVTPDPLPRPVTFPHFSDGFRGTSSDATAQREYQRRLFEAEFNQATLGKQRAFLIITPDHAATIDPPLDAETPYGRVGTFFAFPQRSWPCGGINQYGVALMCQSFPTLYGTSDIPQPEKPLEAVFDAQIKLRGITIKPLGTFYKPGGSVPIELYWQAVAVPKRDYRIFVHLCQLCNEPPLAVNDGPPFQGHGDAGRMTTWKIDDPVHVEHALVLPDDIKPGNYAVIIGVYDNDGQRLPVVSSQGGVLGGDRLIVATIRVVAAD
ncbi:MAG: glycosyltransferase family 39 protein [Roseiflexaceae bacterium]